MPSRSEMYAAIKRDYGGTVLDDHINLVLDMYEQDTEFIERLCKEEKKKHKRAAPEPKTRLTLEDFEQIQKRFQEEQARVVFSPPEIRNDKDIAETHKSECSTSSSE